MPLYISNYGCCDIVKMINRDRKGRYRTVDLILNVGQIFGAFANISQFSLAANLITINIVGGWGNHC